MAKTYIERVGNPKTIEDVFLQCGLGKTDGYYIALAVRRHIKKIANRMKKNLNGLEFDELWAMEEYNKALIELCKKI